ncbi:Stabilin-1 [Manis pentadactyla]|nr:Stabilin-1 [Manis pentadactyla]
MSGCRKRCKREILKFAQYLLRLLTGSLHTGNGIKWTTSYCHTMSSGAGLYHNGCMTFKSNCLSKVQFPYL